MWLKIIAEWYNGQEKIRSKEKNAENEEQSVEEGINICLEGPTAK